MSTDSDTLERILEYLTENDLKDPQIFSSILPIDVPRLQSAVARFSRVEALKGAARATRKSMATWTSQQNRLKGECFERIMRVLLPTGTVFNTWHRVQTTTNEIDILVGLTTKSKWLRLFDKWGTHFICECKSERGHFSVSWVDKLFAILTTHNSYAGVLVSAKAPSRRGNGRRALNKIRMLAVTQKVILVLDMDDIQQCIQGTHILSILQKKYIETTTGAANLELL